MFLTTALLCCCVAASTGDDAIWFYLKGDDTRGPMTLAQLRDDVDAMIVVDDTPIWRSGDDEPMLASSVPELADLFPPPIPKAAATPAPARPTTTTTTTHVSLPVGLAIGGAALGVAGLVFDLASPSSANQRVDALDFVGPTAIAAGVGLAIGAAVVANGGDT
jgi:hypothetical protein